MTFYIEKFASSLCLGFATGQSTHNPQLKYFNYFKNPVDVCKVIQKLYGMYRGEFHSIIEEILNEEKYDSFELSMKVILSRCIKLSTSPTYMSFMLVCTLITITIFHLFQKVKCFTFAKVASNCLIAMYERCYKYSFNHCRLPYQTEADFVSFFCKSLNETLPISENEETDLGYSYEEIKTSLKNLIGVDAANFPLTRFEEKLLKDASIYSKLNSSSCSSKDETWTYDSESNLTEEENQVCSKCKGVCSNIFLTYQAEINFREY